MELRDALLMLVGWLAYGVGRAAAEPRDWTMVTVLAALAFAAVAIVIALDSGPSPLP